MSCETAADTDSKCPECGSGLNRPRAVRIGHRRRRPFAIGFALIMLVGCMAGSIYARQLAAIDWIKSSPNWLVSLFATSSFSTVRDSSQMEMLERLRDDRLTADDASSFVDKILVIQADAKASWSNELGDFVHVAWRKGYLDSETMSAYARNLFSSCWIEVPAQVERLSSFTCKIHVPSLRATQNNNGMMLTWGIYPQESHVGAELFPQGPPYVRGGRRIDHQRFEPMWLQFGLTPRVVIGKTTVRVRCHFDLIDCLANDDSARTYGTHGKIIASVELDRTAETNVVDRYGEIRLAANPTLEETIRSCISVGEQIIRPDFPGQSFIENSVLIDKPPTDLAFDVIWRIGEHEHRAARLYAKAGEFGRSMGCGGPRWISQDVRFVDVILRPSRISAWEAKLTEIWDGPEIVYKDLPLIWDMSNVKQP